MSCSGDYGLWSWGTCSTEQPVPNDPLGLKWIDLLVTEIMNMYMERPSWPHRHSSRLWQSPTQIPFIYQFAAMRKWENESSHWPKSHPVKKGSTSPQQLCKMCKMQADVTYVLRRAVLKTMFLLLVCSSKSSSSARWPPFSLSAVATDFYKL